MRAAGLILAILLLVPVAGAAAEETAVTAAVDSERIGENESLTLRIEVKGASLPPVEEPDLGAVADFTVASGPNLSSSTSMVWSGGGARMTSIRQYTYVLLPKRRGTLRIPPIPVRVGDAERRTEAIAVEVVAGSPRREGSGRRSGRSPSGGSSGARRSAEEEPDLFMEATLDRERVYVGEQVLLVYRLYTQAELAALPQPTELPAFTDFWVEEIPVDPRSTIRRATVRGREYTEITLMKRALFPTRSGALAIEETVFEIPIQHRSSDPFERFLGRARAVYRRTPVRTLRVLPLPEENRPDAFSGGVGRFTLSVTADRLEAQVNDAIGLTVEVEGDGNLSALGRPILPDLPDYRLYDPKVEEERRLEGDRIRGKRTWSYVLVPLAPGEKSIPPVRFAYFDPSARAYRELSNPPISLSVSGTAAGPLAGGAGAARRDVVAMRRDIRYIKPASSLGTGLDGLRKSPWFLVLILLPVAGNAALFVHLRRREHLSANVHLFRRRRASRVAGKRLRAARRLAADGAASAFYAEMDRALTGYLADKFNVAAAGLTRDRITELLGSSRVPDSVRAETLRCLEQCDYGRFAPDAAAAARLQSVLERGERAVSALERCLG